MLFVNGYTTTLWQALKLAPKPHQAYWGDSLRMAGKYLNDWNWWFINGSDTFFSTAQKRFERGYRFAESNSYQLLQHILVSGNSLRIVAHSQGVAFAEGIAAYLWCEKHIQTELLICLQTHQAATIPQIKDAARWRVQFCTKGDKIANKRGEKLYHKDVSIEEKLLGRFIRYDFKLEKDRDLDYTLFLKGGVPFFREHTAHLKRTWCVWQAVKAALMLLEEQEPAPSPRRTKADIYEVFPN